ncbi:GDSL-type esterase/lipase family protein [Anoxybacillus rupiensis]|uniref:GDSL-type esterase/lipase family protein n=1 Tax=Anoxybacteroides rupiense TaxID=311460 RepID=A0ABD5IU96_9BACL|nr:GDSL-type esterase/lipase family protein [Anoxybacillus rupiensis]
MKKWGLLFLSLLLSGGCSATEAMKMENIPLRQIGLPNRLIIDQDFIPRDWNVVAFGDSLTEGVGDRDHQGGYVFDLKEKLLHNKGVRSVTVTNLGKRGLRLSQLQDVIQSHEQEIREADMVLITIGGNDIMKVVRSHLFDLTYDLFEKNQKSFAAKLDRLMQSLRALNPHATIVLVGVYNPFSSPLQDVPEINEVIDMWNRGSQAVLSKYDRTIFVDVKDLFDDRDDLLYDDQFHPNELGYEKIAERVYEHLLGSMEQ